MAPLTTVDDLRRRDASARAGLAARTCRAGAHRRHPERGRRRAPSRGPALDGDPPRIVAVGRLAEPKDASDARARARRRLAGRRSPRSLVGDGPDRPAVEAELRALGLSDAVELLGRPRRRAGAARAAPTCSCSRAAPKERRSRSSRRWRPGCRWSRPTSAASPSSSSTARRACSCPPASRRRWRPRSARLLADAGLRAPAGRGRAGSARSAASTSPAAARAPRAATPASSAVAACRVAGAVAQPPVDAAERQRRVVTAADLGAGSRAGGRARSIWRRRSAERSRGGQVDPRLAGDRGRVARLGDEPSLALAVQAGRVGEGGHRPPEVLVRARAGRPAISARAAASSTRSRLGCVTVCASKRSVPSRSSATTSSQPSTGGCCRAYHGNRSRPSVTPVVTNTVARKPWRSSTGSAWSRDVREAVVEREADRTRGGTSPASSSATAAHQVDHRVALGGQVLHLLAEAPGGERRAGRRRRPPGGRAGPAVPSCRRDRASGPSRPPSGRASTPPSPRGAGWVRRPGLWRAAMARILRGALSSNRAPRRGRSVSAISLGRGGA